MARGNAKALAQEKNAKKLAGKKEAKSDVGARAAALQTTCPVCKAQVRDGCGIGSMLHASHARLG